MTMMVYNGIGLDVDLSRGSLSPFPLEEGFLLRYLGGRGLGVGWLTEREPFPEDPLGEEAPLIFVSGALNGSSAPTSGRFSVTCRSPLTGTIVSANSGGFFGPALKRSGFDMVVVRGKSPKPVWLNIQEGEASLHEASDLWGLGAAAATERLRNLASPQSRVLAIGQAGERGVLFASLVNDGDRTAGRGGCGAVMGSKNLKALVVHGSRTFPAAKEELYKAALYQTQKLIRSFPVTARALPELGTPGLVKLMADHDMLPHRNFQDVAHRPEDVELLSGENLRKTLYVGPTGCALCPIRCGREIVVQGVRGGGPEYETLANMGANLGIYDLQEISLANYLCNDLGMDTISLGGTLAAAMELFERGVLTVKETGGIPLAFGSKGFLCRLTEMTGLREGFGKILSEGSLRLARRFGVPELSISVKGLELPGYEPRATTAQALGYATSPRGGCHLQGGYAVSLGFFGGSREVDRFLIDTVAGHVIDQQDSGCLSDSLGLCRFASFSLGEGEFARLFAGFTGAEIDQTELQDRACLIQNQERRFNIRAGFTRRDDTLPERFFTEAIPLSGKNRLIDRELHFRPLLENYYRLRGWDEEGVPPAPGRKE